MIIVHDTNDDENLEYLDAGGTGLSPETISQLKFLKCFGYLCSLQIVVATINGVYTKLIGPSRVHAPVQPSGHQIRHYSSLLLSISKY